MGIRIYQRTGKNTGVSTGPFMAVMLLFLRLSVWLVIGALFFAVATVTALAWAIGYLVVTAMAIPGERGEYRKRLAIATREWTASAQRLARRWR